MNLLRITLVLSTSIAVLLCIVTPASAELIAYDGFDGYSTGSLYGQNGGTGSWTAPYGALTTTGVTVVGGGLSYTAGDVHIDGGSKSVSIGYNTATAVDNLLNRSFSGQTGTVYFSLLFQAVVGRDANDFVQFLLNDDTDDENAASIGMLNGTNNPFFSRLRRDTTQELGSNPGINTTTGSTYLLVGKVSKTDGSSFYNRVDLFINPTTLTEPVANSTAYNAAFHTNTDTLDFFSLRISELEDNGANPDDRYDFDELRIGTTFADVV